jgi:hypothetical protein
MNEPIGIPNKFATGDIEYRNHDTVVSRPIISIINFALGNSRSTIKKMALYGQSTIYIDDEISNSR